MTVSENPHQATAWHELEWGPWPEDVVLPQDPPDPQTRQEVGLPATLAVARGDGVAQTPVFDPALQHYTKAMRAGEPRFGSADAAARWFQARRRALDLALAAVAASPWADHLVLRGSVLLKAWYGDAAREPGDLDFVVVPPTWAVTEPRTERMLDGIAALAGAACPPDDGGPIVRIDAAGAERDEIWTDDRVPGRRLVLPWHVEGDDELPSGGVQLDFLFNELLPEAPVRTAVGGVCVPAVTPELSLAWKILWLLTDSYPQGKDLLDAVLLAEAPGTRLDPELLLRAMADSQPHWAGRRVAADWFDDLGVDADEFHKEHPEAVEDLRLRLVAALRPVFEASRRTPPADGYTWRARVLAHVVATCRELAAEEGMDAVQQWMVDRGYPLTEGAVVTREVAGPDRMTLEQAGEVFLAYRRPGSNGYGYWRLSAGDVQARLAELKADV